MKIKKIITALLTALTIMINSSYTIAADNFSDNNALSNIINANKNSNIVLSEYNTGKIIANKNADSVVSYKPLAATLAVFVLSERLRDSKITLDSKIQIAETDDILEKYKIEKEITVKDAIFLLEQEESQKLLDSVMKFLGYSEGDFQQTLDKLTALKTELKSFTYTEENKTTAKNLAYITTETINNFPEITELTKNPQYKLQSGEEVDNDVKFIESDKIRVLGLNYNENNATFIAYSGNTRIIITLLNIEEKKDEFFDNLQKTLEYIFSNYSYKLALKAGTYDINNENITLENDIYDLFYKEHSEKDVRYFLMNNKILLFQNYEYLSANSGTVFSNYKSNTNNTTLTTIKNTFLQDNNFSKKTKEEKLTIILDRTQYFAAFVVLVYTAIFIILYILRKPFKKGD